MSLQETAQWQRVKELFDSALHCAPGEREQFLSCACGSNAALRAEIESLLVAHAQAGALSQAPISVQTPPEVHEGEIIGPYHLTQRIGQGGMGEVWLANQIEPLQRQVALKLIRNGLFDESLKQRFQAERQSLAMMEHPAIAKVFDAGVTSAGHPYLVMEYVPGEPITCYCDRKRMTIRERLELFSRVCDGVQHAHQKAVIHRDLKPANILVIEVDGQAAPRIIDFGLASIIEQNSTANTNRVEILAGTPGYMSPEQIAGADLDTRTDVYSLGVVLYQLLTGSLPFEAAKWHQEPYSSLPSRLEGQPPIPPSRRPGSDSEIAESRHCTPHQLGRQLAGDLDLIAAKALAYDRSQRYGTPLELAADIRLCLAHRPITAHVPSARYSIEKYVRRHRVGTIMASVLAMVLIGAAVLETMALRRIARERDRAARISDFMVSSFRIADPSEARGNQVTAREVLDRAYGQIDPGLDSDPDMQSQMMMVMGAVYENLGLYSRAEALYRKAEAVRERRFGAENIETLRSQTSIAWTLYRRGRYRESEQMLRDVLAVRMRRWGGDSADTITVMDYLGAVLNEEGRATEAESLERNTLSWRMRVDGLSSPETLVSMNHLALALQSEGRWKEAENLHREQIAGWQRVEGTDSLRGMFAADNLAIILYREDRLQEAEALDRQTLATKRHVLGMDHPETVRSMNTLTAVLTDEGKLQEARSLANDVVAIRTRVLGPEHPLTLSAMSNLAEILTRLGDYGHAEDLLQKAKEGDKRVLGPNSPQAALVTYNMACLALRRKHSAEALQLLQEALGHGLQGWIAAGMSKDPDLAELRGDPRFEALVAQVNRAKP